METKRFVAPKKNASESFASAGAEGITSAIETLTNFPGISAPAKVIFNWLFGSSYEKRLERWRAEIGETVRKLHEVWGISYKDLLTNEDFHSVVYQATIIATKTHQEEKLESLRIAIENTVLAPKLVESKRKVFLNLIDNFSEMEIRILHYLDDPMLHLDCEKKKDIDRPRKLNLIELVLMKFPEYSKDFNFIKFVLNDLNSKQLLTDDVFISIDPKYKIHPSTTQLGREFVQFITEKKADESVSKPAK